ncbi:MAG: D-aminoacyl-tRNA deacylase [bacterium]|nr:D-aminoacyl-tRNA deacylase [bacterium]
MIAVLQRVKRAQVTVNTECIAEIGQGILGLVGVDQTDAESDARLLAKKIPTMRIFADLNGKMNLSLMDIHGELLLVSQFTLCADVYSGRRPSFTQAASPDRAIELLEILTTEIRSQGIVVKSGRFGAYMLVELVNDGPVTFVVDSKLMKLTG